MTLAQKDVIAVLKELDPNISMPKVADLAGIKPKTADRAYQIMNRKRAQHPDAHYLYPIILNDAKRTGRLPVISEEQKETLAAHAVEHHNGNHKVEFHDLAKKYSIPGCRTTVDKAMREKGIGRYKMREKPFLSGNRRNVSLRKRSYTKNLG
ncbi:hypothetical protein BJ508DRAFT_336690 [Ascobolus immersus RN42]|uniref:Transposase Tc1-like domain-containing protein n=1 Tax=Ascobolus immersus RN42 TaxID=1160509 RepID=A0A3N4HMJ5_ASCIM|nr:hypothetical protein BJ508DRAFT_336690 [Ascobolus immersus RN42]